MGRVGTIIKDQFEGHEKPSDETRPLQKNGTCTHSSTISWLQSFLKNEKNTFGEDLFTDIDRYMIGSGIRYLTSQSGRRAYIFKIKGKKELTVEQTAEVISGEGRALRTEALEKVTKQYQSAQKKLQETNEILNKRNEEIAAARESHKKVVALAQEKFKTFEHTSAQPTTAKNLLKQFKDKFNATTQKMFKNDSELIQDPRSTQQLTARLDKRTKKFSEEEGNLKSSLVKLEEQVKANKISLQDATKRKEYIERLLGEI
jgi:hypothetical protein